MNKKINTALISVYYKDGLESIVGLLSTNGVTIYSTGGTQQFIEGLGIPVTPVETLTGFPAILGGRVKTLHPSVFGGILGKRSDAQHIQEMRQYNIPDIDLVIVDLYPFEETVASVTASTVLSNEEREEAIIEKIDIGGPSMIRGAAKNHRDVVVIADKNDYPLLKNILTDQQGETTLEQRRIFAIKAFDVCTAYDNAISNYFHDVSVYTPFHTPEKSLRYGENPHQKAACFGALDKLFEQLSGKELSYNNLVDVDAAVQLINEFSANAGRDAVPIAPGISMNTLGNMPVFAIIKHTNVCGAAQRPTVLEAWFAALAGDPESAFGGVLISNAIIDLPTAEAIHELFFEVLIAPGFAPGTLEKLQTKKNRILLQLKEESKNIRSGFQRSLLNGLLIQDADNGLFAEWKECGGRESSPAEQTDMIFAMILCKHLKSNAIALVKNKQLIGKGCGQTSRIDSLRHAIEKAARFHNELKGAVLASDAFFPFNDCIQMGHEAGICAFIEPGGSVRDKDSIDYAQSNGLALVLTGMRHFKH